MWLIDQLAERRIAEARDRGELDNLPGAGRPLVLDDDRLIPQHLRVAYRVLKNAGYLPPEALALREVKEAEDLLRAIPAEDGAARAQAQSRLELLRLRLIQHRGKASGPLWTQDNAYATRVAERLGRSDKAKR